MTSGGEASGQRPLGVTLLAVAYIALGIVLLVLPFLTMEAWKASTIVVGPFSLTVGTLKILCIVLGAGLFATAVLFWKAKRLGLYLALAGLLVAVLCELASRNYIHAIVDGAQWGYLMSVREGFTD